MLGGRRKPRTPRRLRLKCTRLPAATSRWNESGPLHMPRDPKGIMGLSQNRLQVQLHSAAEVLAGRLGFQARQP